MPLGFDPNPIRDIDNDRDFRNVLGEIPGTSNYLKGQETKIEQDQTIKDAVNKAVGEITETDPEDYRAPKSREIPVGLAVDDGFFPTTDDIPFPQQGEVPTTAKPGEITTAKLGRATAQHFLNIAKEIATLPERFIKSAGNQTLTESDPTGTNAMIETSLEVAGAMAGANAPFIPENSVGLFGGRFARGMQSPEARPTQQLFDYMEYKGYDKWQIYDATGLYRGKDNKIKFEISDRGADLNYSGFTITDEGKLKLGPTPPPSGHASIEEAIEAATRTQTLGDILDHPELYKQYPQLKDLPVIEVPIKFRKKAWGVYDSQSKTLAVGELQPSTMKSVILHEVQHAIQDMEGFARGGNPKMFESARFQELSKELKQRNKKLAIDLRDLGMSKSKIDDALMDWELNQTGFKQSSKEILQEALDNGLFDEAVALYKASKVKVKYDYEAHRVYKSLAGEVESRNVQMRDDPELMSLLTSRPPRESFYPFETEDVPFNEQKVMFR